MVTEPIEDFVLANDHNFRIAEAVFEAWPKACQKVAREFLERLRERLKKELKNWDFGGGERCFEDAYSTFSLWKPDWDHYVVGLQFAAHGEKMQFGVIREKAIHGKRPFSEVLL